MVAVPSGGNTGSGAEKLCVWCLPNNFSFGPARKGAGNVPNGLAHGTAVHRCVDTRTLTMA